MVRVQKLSALDDICQTHELWQLIIKGTFKKGRDSGSEVLLTLLG